MKRHVRAWTSALHAPRVKLLLGIVMLIALVYGVLPALEQSAVLRPALAPALREGVDVSATFYTDIPHSARAEVRARAAVARARTAAE